MINLEKSYIFVSFFVKNSLFCDKDVTKRCVTPPSYRKFGRHATIPYLCSVKNKKVRPFKNKDKNKNKQLVI